MAFTLLMDARLMSSKFRPVDRDTLCLLPPSVQDWLPDDHLARFVVDVVDRLDLSVLERQCGGGGKDPHHPSLLLGLLFHGCATGVFSSRRLERATHDSVAFRCIAANSHPDHDTTASFRRRFLEDLQGLFVRILLIAQETGLLKLGNASLDGTKVQANASRHRALGWGHAKRLGEQLRAEVSALPGQAAQAEDSEPELDVPEELKRRAQRLAVIEAAQAEIERRAQERHAAEQADREERLEARREKEKETGRKPRGRPPQAPQAGPRDADQVNLTDPESRIMPTSNGFEQACNAQSGVDVESHLAVTADVVDRCNDRREVAPALEALDALPAALGQPVGLLADTGHFSRGNVANCGGRISRHTNISSYTPRRKSPTRAPLGSVTPFSACRGWDNASFPTHEHSVSRTTGDFPHRRSGGVTRFSVGLEGLKVRLLPGPATPSPRRRGALGQGEILPIVVWDEMFVCRER